MSAQVPPPAPGSIFAPILVVEDDEATREALRMFLEDEGYEVATSATTAEALTHLQAALTGRVVLLDWRMAHNGGSLLKAVEQEDAAGPLHRHCLVLLTAASLDQLSTDEQRLIATYCVETVTKPLELTALLHAVERAAAQLPT